MFIEECKILANEQIASDCWKISLKTYKIAEKAKPGQFVHIRCAEQLDPLLRRPFSIYKTDIGEGVIEVAYKVIGKGTNLLARKKVGECLNVLGPLGRGFNIKKHFRSILLVGEGVGVASIMHLAQEFSKLEKASIHAIICAKEKTEVMGEADLRAFGAKIKITYGKGWMYQDETVKLMENLLRNEAIDQAFGCGSNHLLAKTSQIAERYGIPYQVSLYQNMACGIGACLCCARKFKSDFGVAYRLVCRDGPVFDSREVVWEV